MNKNQGMISKLTLKRITIKKIIKIMIKMNSNQINIHKILIIKMVIKIITKIIFLAIREIILETSLYKIKHPIKNKIIKSLMKQKILILKIIIKKTDKVNKNMMKAVTKKVIKRILVEDEFLMKKIKKNRGELKYFFNFRDQNQNESQY